MIVIEDTESGKIVGWVWMEKKQNSLTGEVYANFKSIYADECIRGMQIVDDLFEKSIEYARECKAALYCRQGSCRECTDALFV